MVITRERKQTNDKGKCDLKINDGNKSVRSIALIFIEYMGHSGSQPKNYIWEYWWWEEIVREKRNRLREMGID